MYSGASSCLFKMDRPLLRNYLFSHSQSAAKNAFFAQNIFFLLNAPDLDVLIQWREMSLSSLFCFQKISFKKTFLRKTLFRLWFWRGVKTKDGAHTCLQGPFEYVCIKSQMGLLWLCMEVKRIISERSRSLDSASDRLSDKIYRGDRKKEEGKRKELLLKELAKMEGSFLP